MKEQARLKGLTLNSFCLNKILEDSQMNRIENYLKRLIEKNGIK